MAKLMVSTLALIAMVGLIDASPLLGGLAGGGAQGQAQGLLSLTGGNGGLLTGVVGTATELLNSVLGGVQQQTQIEVGPGMQEAANAAVAAAIQAKNQGLRVREALIAAQYAASQMIQPRVTRVTQVAAIGAVSTTYNVPLQGTYSELVA